MDLVSQNKQNYLPATNRHFKRIKTKNFFHSSAVFWCSFISGCAAGSTAALLVNPFDVVKTRCQVIKKAPGEPSYDGVMDCIG